MSRDWHRRFGDVVAEAEKRGISKRSLSLSAGHGPNYVQQLLGKDNVRVNELLDVLDKLGPAATAYVFTGILVTDQDLQFLRGTLGIAEGNRDNVLALAERLASPRSEPEGSPSEPAPARSKS